MSTATAPLPAHYIEVLLLQGDEKARALQIARAIVMPCLAAVDGLDDMQRLRFWLNLVAHTLDQAEASVGPDGRMAIVQCMRSAASATHCAPGVVQ